MVVLLYYITALFLRHYQFTYLPFYFQLKDLNLIMILLYILSILCSVSAMPTVEKDSYHYMPEENGNLVLDAIKVHIETANHTTNETKPASVEEEKVIEVTTMQMEIPTPEEHKLKETASDKTAVAPPENESLERDAAGNTPAQAEQAEEELEEEVEIELKVDVKTAEEEVLADIKERVKLLSKISIQELLRSIMQPPTIPLEMEEEPAAPSEGTDAEKVPVPSILQKILNLGGQVTDEENGSGSESGDGEQAAVNDEVVVVTAAQTEVTTTDIEIETTTAALEITTTEVEVATTTPETTSTEVEATTTEVESTTTEAESTTTVPETTTTEVESTTTGPEITTAGLKTATMVDEAKETDPTNKSDNEPMTVDLSQKADSQKTDSQDADSQGDEVASENSIESVDLTVDESANQAVTPEEAFFVAETAATAASITQPRQTRNRWRNKFQRGRQNRRQRNRRNRRREQLRNGRQAANTGRWRTGLAALLSKPLLLSGRTRDVNEKEGDEDLSFTRLVVIMT